MSSLVKRDRVGRPCHQLVQGWQKLGLVGVVLRELKQPA
jgi:hypothetical protein